MKIKFTGSRAHHSSDNARVKALSRFKKNPFSALSVRDAPVGIILALFRYKGPRPGFFLQTKQSQGLSIARTPEDAQQKAWGKALVFRGPFCLTLISLDILNLLHQTFHALT
jgi:hypothetical protein